MLTQSGIEIIPGGGNAPALQDIAVGLGRMPRFAGQTRGWWSVLHHSFVVELFLRMSMGGGGSGPFYRPIRLAALLHDAHEAVTGDVPTTWKTADLKERQRALDVRIGERYGVDLLAAHSLISQADRAALLAEGQLVGPPGFAALEGAPGAGGIYAVEYVQAKYPDPLDTIDPNGRAVRDFLTLVRELQDA
ncbi:MAG TPA: hypothetical protein VFI41_12550 [Gemmatimonadales bacterium]|nr:hypothetical protein [Gemmatimonadales bacterium]